MPTSDQLSNWDEIWKNFEWEDLADSEEVVRERLRQRAQQYAAPVQRHEFAAEDARSLLTFVLGSEHYGVDVMLVQGVRTIQHVTRVPGVPPFYRGVVNVRGQVITVMDLRLFFDMAVSENDALADELVIVSDGVITIGLLAHNVEGVASIPLENIEPVDNMRYAWGVTKSQLVLLDIERLLHDEQLIVGGQDEN